MAETIKDNEYILAHQEEFQKTYQRALEHFSKFDGVVGVAFGQKYTDKTYNNNIAIIIYVLEKKQKEDTPPEQFIPKYFEGYLTDVKIVGKGKLGGCDNTADYIGVPGGIRGGMQIASSIKNGGWEVGTLSCIVRRKNDSNRENVYVLSNKHVLWANGNNEHDYAYHPFAPGMNPQPQIPNMTETATRVNHSLGRIQPQSHYGHINYTPVGTTVPINLFIDCAIARIDIDCKCLGTTCTQDNIHYSENIIDLQVNSVNTISDVRSIITDVTLFDPAHPENKEVYKVGRTTGRTKGIIRAVNASILGLPLDFLNPAAGTVTAGNIIEIDFDPSSTPTHLNCHGNAFFGESGDSGSLVVDRENRAVGLLFAVPLSGSTGAQSCGACHILPILEHLGICIPTTGGTSRCSCQATDGTGLTPAPTSGAGSGGGSFGITNAPMRINNDRDAGLFQPEPVTEKQQERLTYLLNAFRSTERGRELHAAFTHVRREVGYLVRNCRPVTVAWHRNKGPGFFACFLNHLRGDLDKFPHRIGEYELSVLFDKMEVQLLKHGSIPLRETIERYGEQLRAMVLSGNDVNDFINQLKKMETE